MTVRVLSERPDGSRGVVSHFNKATKGRLVRDLLIDGSRPRTPARFAELLRDLGWTVEEEGGPPGTGADVPAGPLEAGGVAGGDAGGEAGGAGGGCCGAGEVDSQPGEEHEHHGSAQEAD